MNTMSSRLRGIKQAQREKLLFREISDLFLQASYDDAVLKGVSISRVELSPDKGTCFIYFFAAQEGQEKEQLDRLKLYGPSLRSALARRINKRYTPEIVFKFDALHAKRQKLEDILNSIADEESV